VSGVHLEGVLSHKKRELSQKRMFFKIRRIIMMKIRMTRTVAHITMPPFFCVLSA
jgi:hypothetical protein